MINKVKIGGTVRAMGGRADGFLHRVATWLELDREAALECIVGDAAPTTRQEVLMHMVHRGITTDLVATLESIHNDLCRLYIRHISRWVIDDGPVADDKNSYVVAEQELLTPEIDIEMPDVVAGRIKHSEWVMQRYNKQAQAMQFWVSNCAKPGENYRDSSWLLKNIRFSGWTPDRKSGDALCPDDAVIKGFCKHEPVVRFKQLLAFPIDRFGLDLDQLQQRDWPTPPAPVEGDNPDTIETARALRPELEAWESYYTALVVALRDFHLAVDAL